MHEWMDGVIDFVAPRRNIRLPIGGWGRRSRTVHSPQGRARLVSALKWCGLNRDQFCATGPRYPGKRVGNVTWSRRSRRFERITFPTNRASGGPMSPNLAIIITSPIGTIMPGALSRGGGTSKPLRRKAGPAIIWPRAASKLGLRSSGTLAESRREACQRRAEMRKLLKRTEIRES